MTRHATESDIHRIATSMPFVTDAGTDLPVYQVGAKSFVFFRTPRPDAFDPDTGERFDDVVVIWVPDEADKQALVDDPTNPFFTTPHFNGHPSVLVRLSRLAELDLDLLTEVIEDAWLSRASASRARRWLAAHPRVADA